MTELVKIISTTYNILEQMAVTGPNQELIVAAKAQLRKAIDIARDGDDNGGK